MTYRTQAEDKTWSPCWPCGPMGPWEPLLPCTYTQIPKEVCSTQIHVLVTLSPGSQGNSLKIPSPNCRFLRIFLKFLSSLLRSITGKEAMTQTSKLAWRVNNVYLFYTWPKHRWQFGNKNSKYILIIKPWTESQPIKEREYHDVATVNVFYNSEGSNRIRAFNKS